MYIIGDILDRRILNGRTEYYVKWKDYPASYNSWEPRPTLKQAWDMVDEYDKKADKLIKNELKKQKPIKKIKNLEKESKKEDSTNSERAVRSKSRSKYSTKNDGNEKKIEKLEKIDKCYKNIMSIVNDEQENHGKLPNTVLKLDIHQDGKLSALVKFNNGSTGLIGYEEFKSNYPQKMLEFYESRIVFPFENLGTKRFHEVHKKPSITK